MVDAYGRNVEVITLLTTVKPLLNTISLWGKNMGTKQNMNFPNRANPPDRSALRSQRSGEL